jgi:uncharacterized protein YjbI with pentapeptide repeats
MMVLGLKKEDIEKLNLTKKDLANVPLTKKYIVSLNLTNEDILRLKLTEEDRVRLKLTKFDIGRLNAITKKLQSFGLKKEDLENWILTKENMQQCDLTAEDVEILKMTKENIERLVVFTDEDVENLKLTNRNMAILKLTDAAFDQLSLTNVLDILKKKEAIFRQDWLNDISRINKETSNLDGLRKKLQSYIDMEKSTWAYLQAFQTVELRRREKSASMSAADAILLIIETEVQRKPHANNRSNSPRIDLLTQLKAKISAEKRKYLLQDEERDVECSYVTHIGIRSRPMSPQKFDKKFAEKVMTIARDVLTPAAFNSVAADHENTLGGWARWLLFRIHCVLKTLVTLGCSDYSPTLFATKGAKKLAEIQTQAGNLRRIASAG